MPGWSQAIFQPSSISSNNDDIAYAMAKDAEGNTYYSIREYWDYDSLNVFGRKNIGYEAGNVYKFNADGSYAWSLKLPSDKIGSLHVNKDGILYAVSTSLYWGAGTIYKVDRNGILSETQQIAGAMKLRTDKQGNLIVAGKDFVAKYTTTLSKLWEITFNPHADNSYVSIDVDNNGNVVVAGDFARGIALGDHFYESDDQTPGAFVAKINSEGQVLFAKFFGASSLSANVRDVKFDAVSGDIYFTGSLSGTGSFGGQEVKSKGESDFYLAKIDRDGLLKWFKSDGSYGPDYGSSLVVSKEYVYTTGRLYGNIKMDNAQVGYIIGPSSIMARFNKTTGRASWIKGISPSKYDDAGYKPIFIEEIEQKNLKMTGMFHGVIVSGLDTLRSKNEDVFSLSVLDTLSTGTTAQLRGKVVASQNSNCDTTQVGIANMVIKAMPGPIYAMTNENGRYTMNLPVGTYSIAQVLPRKRNMVITQACPATTPKVIVKEPGEKLTPVSFGNNVLLLPYLEVDVATDRFRRCFRNDMVVRYANDGLASVSNVVVKVDFPEHIIPLSSTVPWTAKNGQTLTFKIGTLQAGQRGVIHITDSVRCGDETIRGVTQCVYASISPANNNPEVDPLWDRSDIQVLAKCLETGFVRLGIKNIGTGAMKDSALYRIYSNDQVAFEGKYKLSPGDSLSMQVPSNGRTIRIEAYTTVNSPKNVISDAVEGCGRVVAASIDMGFVNAFSQNDEEVELETFCAEIVDSFDPNDKQVFPSGITDQHNIIGDEELEYLVRFQNTGTDVAYNIVIRDRLDPNVDLATLNIGASSHKYSVKIEGEGNPEIVWTFKNIMLPDSGRNEPGSHGFVKYKIKPLKDLARGTVIRNKAEIYFDYNSPVITNEVFNTIGLPELTRMATVVQDCSKELRIEAGDDESRAVCDLSSVVLSHQLSEVGYGQWKVLEGSGDVVESASALEIKNLVEGENVFEYSLTYCNNTDKRTVSVNRTITPAVPSVQEEYLFCSATVSGAAIELSGTNLTWFDDSEMKQVRHTGNSFKPTGTDVLFVTDSNNECVSAAAVVKVVVNASPAAPSAKAAEGCANTGIALSASGDGIVWYREPGATEVAYSGNSIEASFNSPGEHQLFAATLSNGCESERIPVNVKVKGYDRKEIFIQNVITPNGDGLNDAFYLKEDNFEKCAGSFRQVLVYNRFGETIFSSRNPDFTWNGDVATGVYFYSLAFDNGKFEGSITVQK
jgi:gliding motility-associated-like protein/uncharacterized repeat protein (TIGR01451 family)